MNLWNRIIATILLWWENTIIHEERFTELRNEIAQNEKFITGFVSQQKYHLREIEKLQVDVERLNNFKKKEVSTTKKHKATMDKECASWEARCTELETQNEHLFRIKRNASDFVNLRPEQARYEEIQKELRKSLGLV